MKRCTNLVDTGRRQFLRGASVAAAGLATAAALPEEAKAASTLARVSYPANRLGNVSELKLNAPVDVSYPDADAPGVLLKLGQRVEGGAGTNGFQEPATDFKDGKIVGTKRLFTDGKFGTKDGKATFMEAQWRGLQAPGKDEQKQKFKYLINNGRANHVWQSAYLDIENELVMDRWPYPFIEMNPEDMTALSVKQGDLVEVWNDAGSTQAMVYPTPAARKGQTFMLFAFPTGVQGNIVNAGTNELIIPNYKQTWVNIRKISDAPEGVKHLTFKSQEYTS